MRINDYLRTVRKEAKEPKPGLMNGPPPKGWLTIREIQKLLGMRWAANASTRAKNLHERGILDRMEWKAYRDYGFSRAFIYKLRPPYKTWQEAIDAYNTVGQEKVPKGWARPVEFARMLGISAEAIRNTVHRYGLPVRLIRTNRGSSGLHNNMYVREADILRVYQKRL